MAGLSEKEKRELEQGKVPDVYENSSDLYDALFKKDKEVVVAEIGECQPEDIKTAGEAIREFKALCFNYQDKWSPTTFKYFIKCCDLIEERLAQAAKDRKLIEDVNSLLSDLSGLKVGL